MQNQAPTPRRVNAARIIGAGVNVAIGLVIATSVFVASSGAQAQGPTQTLQPPSPAAVGRAQPALARPEVNSSLTGDRVTWGELSIRQRAALEPLQKHWGVITPDNQQKWLEIASRFRSMSPAEQFRIQERMTEWTQMTPQERGKARLRFQEAKRLPLADRQARWQEFQTLSPEQRNALSERASQVSRSATASPPTAKVGQPARRPNGELGSSPTPKAGAAPDLSRTVREVAVKPALVQAKPGASTTLMSRRPATPQSPNAGAPKIAAAPDVVNAATLLPRVGPQSASAQRPQPVRPASVLVPATPQELPAPTPPPTPSMDLPNPEFYK
ncbi:hypothetical protein BH09PSE5_BH09PSE5_43930 [soil metagenome]